jgi:hypothetical protein
MEKYTMDPSLISMDYFLKQTQSKKMLPSRISLQENSDENFRLLKNQGIDNLSQLIKALGNKKIINALAQKTGIPQNTLTLLKREAGSYLAKPFPISDLPGIPYEYSEVLKTKGIRNTRDYFESVQTASQRENVSGLTGIPESRLMEIACLCDLTRITGVGALYARFIYDSGIRSAKEFAKTEPAFHFLKYKERLKKYKYPIAPVSEEDIQYCIDYANVIVEMTPEK